MITLGFVVGLAAEGRIAARLGPIAVGGGLPMGAEVAAEALVAQGVQGLVSFGLAGGLDPALRPGALVCPAHVREGETLYATTPLLGVRRHGTLFAGEDIVTKASEKLALFASTCAVAVDLESGAVARVAARHGLPFAVLRAICDPAGQDLPPAALVALNGGAIGVTQVLLSLARSPTQLPALLALAKNTAAARAALISFTRGG